MEENTDILIQVMGIHLLGKRNLLMLRLLHVQLLNLLKELVLLLEQLLSFQVKKG